MESISFLLSLLLLAATASAQYACGTGSDAFINAGGKSVKGYRCDAAYPWVSSNKIPHSVGFVTASTTGCKDQYLTSTYAKTGDLVYTIPVPAGSYDVTLMFSEPVIGFKTGSRLFSVKVGNKVVKARYDVIDVAGGARKPIILTTTASPVGGNIVVTLGRIKENPFINAIAIKGTNAAQTIGSAGLTSCTTGVVNPVVPSAAGACPKAGDIAVNAGGVSTGNGYRCDVPGLWRTSTHKWTDSSAVQGATGCTEQYKTHASNFGNLVYKFPVPAGEYAVTLMFSENYAPHKAGSREFTIDVNGKALKNGAKTTFDIFALSGGLYTPYVVSTTADAVGGFITITLGKTPKNYPMISGIVISGTNADALIGASGSTAACEKDTVTSSPAPSPPTGTGDGVAQCPTAGTDDVMINAGGSFTTEGWRCDVPELWRPGTYKYSRPGRQVITKETGCLDVYKSHASTFSGDLKYSIPVPNGAYTVKLLFNDNVFGHEVNTRKFKINVNGKALSAAGSTTFDIIALAGAIDTPYITSTTTSVTNEKMLIDIVKVPGANNPMISGIIISGTGASNLITTSGVGNCEKGGPPGASPSPSPGTTTEPPLTKCGGPNDVFINAGGTQFPGFRCDVPELWATTKQYPSKDPIVPALTGCSEQYLSHAYVETGDLTYTVPVAQGTYDVYLYFMENYKPHKVGDRVFTVSVNDIAQTSVGTDQKFDIVKLAGGSYKPWVKKVSTGSVNSIKIEIGRLTENPFLSGVGIVGTGATASVLSTGVSNCLKPPVVGEPPKDCPTNLKAAVADFDDDAHTAHAVSGGPYVGTDFSGTGKVKIQLDGRQSHSHGATAAGSVLVKEYIWTYSDENNPAADPTTGKVVLLGPTPAPLFPVGSFPITLEVRDEQCDRAIDTTTITINPARTDGAYCYFYNYDEDEPAMVPIEKDITKGKLPGFAKKVGDINFANAAAWNMVPFADNSFAVRCVFSKENTKVETLSYKIMHSGPIKVYTDGVMVVESTSREIGKTTDIPPKSYTAGLHQWEVQYFNPKTLVPGQLKLLKNNGNLVPMEDYGYDASKVIPVITESDITGGPAGSSMEITGSGFFNGVTVSFGMEEGETLEVTANKISVRVPDQKAGITAVAVKVSTAAGVSNDFTFQYPVPGPEECQKINWFETSLKAKTGNGNYFKKNIIVIKYGPDGRLYAGTSIHSVLVLALNSNLKVTFDCEQTLGSGVIRYVTGLNFNPKSLALKLYMSTATINWNKKKDKTGQAYINGWTNGKVQTITAKPNGCFNNDVADLVTGLPVTNHDHTPSWIQFLPDGRMLLSVGGFTNGGITDPGDKLGGVPPPPYAGAILSCPPNKLTAITYSNALTPDKAKVTNTGGCTIYAPGLRNSFGGILATNGELYCTDNSPNETYGDFSTDCNGGKIPSADYNDMFFKIEEGKCHGHPHIPRALADNDPAQCVFRSKDCVQPLWNDIPRSTNGIIEYRSNMFNGAFKGNIFLSKYSVQTKGRIQRLIMDDTGGVKKNGFKKNWHLDSGLHMVEGPRGEMIMNRYLKGTFFVYKPTCMPAPKQLYLIAVHPKVGPATGGHTVLISGFNFGDVVSATFGNKKCTKLVKLDDTQFTCVTPAGIPNTHVKVKITGAGGEMNTPTEGSDYSYW